MKKNLVLMMGLIAFCQLSFAGEIYKENFPGGVYIHNGDEAYVNLKDVPIKGSTKSRDLIINTLANKLVDKWSPAQAQALTFCISDKFGKDKARVGNAVIGAMKDWMSVAGVRFVYLAKYDSTCDQNNKNVVFDIRSVTGQPYLARAFFPNTPRASRNILIDSSSLAYDDVALTGFVRHELGHVLGFRHEHISPSANGRCKEDTNFSPLTSYDPTSVMHYPQCGGTNIITNMILSRLDEEGARKAYPIYNYDI